MAFVCTNDSYYVQNKHQIVKSVMHSRHLKMIFHVFNALITKRVRTKNVFFYLYGEKDVAMISILVTGVGYQ